MLDDISTFAEVSDLTVLSLFVFTTNSAMQLQGMTIITTRMSEACSAQHVLVLRIDVALDYKC